MYQIVVHPGTGRSRRVAFAVSEFDLDDALDYGRAQRADPLDRQMADAAYHMVIEGIVPGLGNDHLDAPWVLVRDGRIVARNHMAMGVRDSDLA
jgi:hypothetical protein